MTFEGTAVRHLETALSQPVPLRWPVTGLENGVPAKPGATLATRQARERPACARRGEYVIRGACGMRFSKRRAVAQLGTSLGSIMRAAAERAIVRRREPMR